MAVNTRAELIEYCRRELGEPVINLELDDDQVEDRVDSALQFFQDFHYDGTEKIFLKHQITGSRINVSSTANFIVGELVVASTSGLMFVVDSISTGFFITKVTNKNNIPSDAFSSGETLTGQSSGATCTFTSKVKGDIENGYVPVSDGVIGVIRVIPFNNGANSANYEFNPEYQLVVNQFNNLSYTNLIYYEQLMQYTDMLQDVVRPIDNIRFNRHTNKIFLDINWQAQDIGSFLIFECYAILDPEVYKSVYNDRMLKRLVTAKIKHQWGNNLRKFGGIVLLGGVTINANDILSEAKQEIEEVEAEIKDSYSIPPIGFLD